jgi:Ni/Co efflux regulator RcnB
MKRVAIFILLAVSNVAWSMPGEAQSKGAARYRHQSPKAAEKQQKEYEKAAKKQQRRIEKYEKEQRRAAKKAARNATKNVSNHPRTGPR